LVLGAMRLPILEYLRPLGDFYIALLKICVLPFLLSTIPLAVRSAILGGTAGGTIRSLIVWLLLAVATVAAASAVVASVIYHYLPADERVVANIGALVGRSADSIDVEFAIDPNRMPPSTSGPEPGIFSVIPTNIFSALSLNESVRVLVFAIIFGIGMVLTEQQTGLSIFGALRHIQAVCIMIFDWFNLLVPIGIIALIAPQIALLGPEAFSILALFAYACLATGLLLLLTVDRSVEGCPQSETGTVGNLCSDRLCDRSLWNDRLLCRYGAFHGHPDGPLIRPGRSCLGGGVGDNGVIRDAGAQRHCRLRTVGDGAAPFRALL
jgi:Na+/H+-dicarboxylate symporter